MQILHTHLNQFENPFSFDKQKAMWLTQSQIDAMFNQAAPDQPQITHDSSGNVVQSDPLFSNFNVYPSTQNYLNQYADNTVKPSAPVVQTTNTYQAPQQTTNTYQAPQQTTNTNTGLDPHINPATGQWDDNYYASQQPQDPYAGVRNEINSGYNSYFSQLDSMLANELPAQRQAQEGIVNSQYEQGQNDLGTQKTLGMADLNSSRTKLQEGQTKSLRDLGENIRNSFHAGNIFLGQRGASDSSAANQYSYALTQLGSKQRGDINQSVSSQMNDIAGREDKLNTIYNSEINNLKTQRDQKLYETAQWFANAQSSITQMRGTGELNKSKDLASLSTQILNYAMQQAQNAQSQWQTQQNALQQWAMNNSKNITELKSSLGAISAFSVLPPQAQALTGTPQYDSRGNLYTPTGYGSSTEKKYNPLTGQYI